MVWLDWVRWVGLVGWAGWVARTAGLGSAGGIGLGVGRLVERVAWVVLVVVGWLGLGGVSLWTVVGLWVIFG